MDGDILLLLSEQLTGAPNQNMIPADFGSVDTVQQLGGPITSAKAFGFYSMFIWILDFLFYRKIRFCFICTNSNLLLYQENSRKFVFPIQILKSIFLQVSELVRIG